MAVGRCGKASAALLSGALLDCHARRIAAMAMISLDHTGSLRVLRVGWRGVLETLRQPFVIVSSWINAS
jgi:hypothetical protein